MITDTHKNFQGNIYLSSPEGPFVSLTCTSVETSCTDSFSFCRLPFRRIEETLLTETLSEVDQRVIWEHDKKPPLNPHLQTDGTTRDWSVLCERVTT